MSTLDRLKVKILRDTGIELTNFKRTYAGVHQRGSGAFVWAEQWGERTVEARLPPMSC